jgi:peptidoglycan/LPS O-acetylase OafA/YrhL
MHGHDYAAIKSFPAVEDSLAIGCLLAVCQGQLARWHRLIDRWIPLIAIVTVVLHVLHYPKYVRELLIDTLMNIGLALCIDHCIRKRYRILNSAPMVWIGGMSYSIYLCQEPFFDPHVQNWLTMFPLNLVYTLIAAMICRYAVEKPFLDLRSRMSARTAAKASLVEAK